MGRLGCGKEYFAISLNCSNLYEKRKLRLETFCCSVHIILMIPNINNIYGIYITLLQHLYFKKDTFLYLVAHLCINLGGKSGRRKGGCFQANVDKDKFSHLQEWIKAKAC